MSLKYFSDRPMPKLYVEPTQAAATKNEPGMFGNLGRAFGSGALSGLGGIFDFVGAEGIAKQLYGWSDDARASMSQEAQQDMAKPFFAENDQGETILGDGLTDLDTWLLTFANVAGQFVPTAVPGAGAAGAATKALSLGAKGTNVARAAAFGLTGGASATGQGMEQARQEFLTLPDEVKMESDLFRRKVQEIAAKSPELDDMDIWTNAEKAVADQIAQDVRTDPKVLLANFAGSALADPVIGKALTGARIAKSGAFRSALKGFVAEGSTEAGQAAVQEYGINEALSQVDGRDAWNGVGIAALNEGLAGGAFGAGAGLLGGFANRPQPEVPVRDKDADAIRDSNSALAGAFDSLAQDLQNRQVAIYQAANTLPTVSSPALEGELLGPEVPEQRQYNPNQIGMQPRIGGPTVPRIEQKDIIFAADGRDPYDVFREQQAQQAPAIEKKDIIFAPDNSGVKVDHRTRQPFASEDAALKSKTARQMRADGLNPTAVQFGDGWGLVLGPQLLDSPVYEGEYISAAEERAMMDKANADYRPRIGQSDVIFAADRTDELNAAERQQRAEAFADNLAREARNTAANQAPRLPQKDIIFAGDGRAEQSRQEFSQNLQNQVERDAAIPRLPQKDIIFAPDNSGVRVKGNGEVYKSPREAVTSKQARNTKRTGVEVEAVKFGDGWGWRVKEVQPEQQTNQVDDINVVESAQPSGTNENFAFEFPTKRVADSYRHISTNPRNAGLAEQESFDRTIKDITDEVSPLIETEEQRVAFESALSRFKEGYINETMKVANVRQDTVSWHVAGRNNFNSKQAGRRGNAYESAQDAFSSWIRSNVPQIKSAVLKARTPQQVQAEADKATAKARQNDVLKFATQVGYIADDLRNNRLETAKDTRKVANAQMERLLDGMDEEQQRQAIEVSDNALKELGGLVKVVGERSNLGKRIAGLLNTNTATQAVQFKKSGEPFKSEREMKASVSFKTAAANGAEVETVKVEGGFGFRVVTKKPEATTNKTVVGTTSKAFTPSNKSIDVQYRVMEADDLIASNDISGAVNANYPAELQPRDRSRADYQVQMRGIAKNPIPEKLGESTDTDRGAPIVRNGVVESGNGRTIGLKEAYRAGTATAYRDYLAANAEKFGLDPAQLATMKHPILVRERMTQMTPEELTAFTVDSNANAGVTQSPAERAKSDASLLDDSIMSQLVITDDGDLTSNANGRFVRAFAALLGNNEAASYKTADGQWNKSFKDRLMNAVFAKGYDDSDLLASMTESTSPESKNLLTALMNVAGKIGSVKSYDNDVGTSLSDAITQAAALLNRAKREGASVASIDAQADMLTGHTDADIVALAKELESNIRSAKAMTALLDKITSRVLTDVQNMGQTDIFTGEPGARPNVLGVIRDAAGRSQPEQSDYRGNGSLFDSAQDQESDTTEQQRIPQAPERSERGSQESTVATAPVNDKAPADAGVSVSEDPQPSLDSHIKAMKAVRDGTATVESYQAAFAAIADNKDAVIADLNKLTKPELLKAGGGMFTYRNKDSKKAEVVEALYEEMLREFSMDRSYGPTSYFMTSKGIADHKAAKEKALRDLVQSTTEEDLKAFAGEVKKARDEYSAQRAANKAALENPQTLSDFNNLMRSKISDGMTKEEAFLSLTPEQRIRYDELAAEVTKQSRDDAKRAAKTTVKAAGQRTSANIIETKHTRDGYDLFVVQLDDRLSSDDYKTVLASAKKLGGWYSSFRGKGAVPGFQFKDRASADAFAALAAGDTTQAEQQVQSSRDVFEDDKSQSAADRLNAMAERLEQRAEEESSRPRLANTARRARFAAAAEASVERDRALAGTMRNIANAISNGTAKFIDAVRQKTQVEYLQQLLSRARYDEIKARYSGWQEQENQKHLPATVETVDFVKFPSFTAYRSDLATLARQMLEIDGLKKLGQQLMSVADDVTDAYLEFAKENLYKVATFTKQTSDGTKAGFAVFSNRADAENAIRRSGYRGKAIVLPFKRGENFVIMSPSEAMSRGVWKGDGDKQITLSKDFGTELVRALGRKAKSGNGISIPWQLESALENLEKLERMGIQTAPELRSALREFVGLKEYSKAPDKVRQMERDMVGRVNDGLDFFPTPQTIAAQMIEAAELTPDMAVLEPSAGMGHIAEAIRAAGVDPDVVEFSANRRELLELKGFNVLANDFTEVKPRSFYTFGDTFRAPDGTVGVMKGSGGLGSNRVRLVDSNGEQIGFFNRDELEGIQHNGTMSGYDRIIMNPPFSNRRDAEHVQHAYTLLKPGGRIVAIMGEGVFFGEDKKATEFREWLDSVGGTSEKLPENSFMDKSLPVTTGVNTRMVVIDKPASNIMFSKENTIDTKPPRGVSMETARAEAADILNKLNGAAGIKVEILATQADAEKLWNMSLEDSLVRGAFNGQTKTAYIIAENIRSIEELRQTIAHEVIGHGGLQSVIGAERYAEFITRLTQTRKNNAFKTLWARIDRDYDDFDVSAEQLERIKAEEVFAYFVQNKPVSGPIKFWWNAFKRYVQKLLSSVGLMRPEDADIAVMKDMLESIRAGFAASQPQKNDGRKSAASFKKQNLKSSAFERWFGDSKIVNPDGTPMMVYHGSPVGDLSVFDTAGEKSQSAEKGIGTKGAYFTKKPSYAYGYAGMDGSIYPVYLSIKKPLVVTGESIATTGLKGLLNRLIYGRDKVQVESQLDRFRAGATQYLSSEDIDALKAAGYDGIINDQNSEIIVFDPNQIKSAIGNNGDFDPSNPDIRFSKTRTEDQAEALDKLGLGEQIAESISDKAKQRVTETIDTLKSQSFWQRLNEGIFDGLAGIKQAEEAVGVVDPNKQGYVSARLASGLSDILHGVFHYGAPEWRDGVVQRKADTKGLLEVFGMLGDDLNDWLAWMGANRAERLMAEGRENNLTKADIDELKALAAGKEQLFEEVRQEYNKINSAIIDLAEDAGLLNAEQRSGFDEEWYVPFFRDMEEEVDPEMAGIAAMVHGPRSRKGIAGQSAQIKELKGGRQSTKDLLENIIQRQSTMIDAAIKNKAMAEVVGNLEGSPFMQAVESPEIAALSQTELNLLQKVKVMRNGKAEAYTVTDPALLRGLLQIHTIGNNSLFNRMARSAKRFLTAGITLSPDFIVKNFVRDAAHAWMINKDGFRFGADSVKGLRKAFTEDESYRDLIFSGAAFQGGYVHGADPEAAAQQIRRALRSKGLTNEQVTSYMDSLITKGSKLFEAYRTASDKVENANRLGTFEAALSAGKSRRQAAFEAKDLMDYSLKGNFAMIGNMIDMLPFFNARLQGMSKLVRSMKGADGDRVLKVLSANLAMKGLKIAAFSLALAALNDDDERYKELPDWDKDANWHFFLGDDHYRIPKPFELGIIFGTMPERMFHYAAGSQPGSDMGKAAAHAVWNTLALNPIPQLALPVIETLTNKSFFKGSAIESMGDEQRQPEDRYNAYTSETAKQIGAAFGASPKMVEHLILGYTGTLGGYVLSVSDAVARQMLGVTSADTPISRYPVIKAFYQGDAPKTATKFQDEFYKAIEQANEAYGSYKRAVEEGDVVRQQDLKQDEAQALGARIQLNRIQRQINELSKQADRVNNNQELTGAEKRERLDKITRRKNELYQSSYVRFKIGEW